MPTKRRKLEARQISIPPIAVEAWKAGDFRALNRALGIKPWQVSPLDVDGPEPPPWAASMPYGESFPRAWRLRQELIELAGPPGRMDRHGRPLGAG